MQTSSVAGSIGFGWETFKKRPWFFVGAMCIVIAANIVVSEVTKALGTHGSAAFAASVVRVAGSTLIGLGTLAFFLKAHDSVESVSVNDLWHPRLFWKYLGATILAGVVIALAMIPLLLFALFFGIGAFVSHGASGVILGIAIAMGVACLALALFLSSVLVYTPYTVVDRELGPISALKESARISKGHRLLIVAMLLSIVLMNIAGAILFFVGILVSAPVSSLAMVHLYRTLTAPAVSV
ncbi:DUF975 family protein [Candidatus Kaiserbacteria bacterium]|nr:DUF975 family protein [Candidatus Kaiserbacteria bacterium]